ncbi:MAG: hypothetical protein AAF074_05090 [Pseudomonadota bacterium]
MTILEKTRCEPAMKLSVQEDGKCLLAYTFRSSEEATEVYFIIREYFPRAKFVFEQAMH